jgi:hypothetical protein
MKFDAIFTKFKLTDAEVAFLKDAGTATTADMNQSQVASNLYLAKTLDSVADKIIELNNKIEAANDRNSRLMVLLTAGIFAAGLGTAFAAINIAPILYIYTICMVLLTIGIGMFCYRELFQDH